MENTLKFNKNTKKYWLSKKKVIYYYSMNFSVEVECGYIRKDGGNLDGVCRGIDQAVSF